MITKVSLGAIQTESHLLLKLALPILLAQLALTGLGVVDTLMSAQVGTNDLAAIGLGSSIMLPVFMFTTGILLAITPLVAKALGRADHQKISCYLYNGMWVALPLGGLSFLVFINLTPLLDVLSLSSEVYQLTQSYLYYIAFGMPAIALYQVFRFFWEGLGNTLPTMWISFLALLLNIPLNAVFIYGWAGIPAMGAAGCGVASSLVMWMMLLVSLIYVWHSKKTRPFVTFHRKKAFRLSWKGGISPILWLGIPTTLALLFEVSLFSLIALFIAPLGSVVLAGHQVAINFTSLAFMIPLSFSMALTVRIGTEYGRNDPVRLRTSLITGFLFAVVFGVLLSMISYYFRFDIVALYTQDTAVLSLAATLLVFAAVYQVFDAIQVTSAGVLRGLHDSKITMLVTLISYWGIGLGIGYLFALTDVFFPPMGVQGFWLGIVLGLMLAAFLLPLRLNQVYRHTFKI